MDRGGCPCVTTPPASYCSGTSPPTIPVAPPASLARPARSAADRPSSNRALGRIMLGWIARDVERGDGCLSLGPREEASHDPSHDLSRYRPGIAAPRHVACGHQDWGKGTDWR